MYIRAAASGSSCLSLPDTLLNPQEDTLSLKLTALTPNVSNRFLQGLVR